jgi:YHS domain-containing protein
LLPCYSWAGLLVWLLLALGVIAFFVSLFKETAMKRQFDEPNFKDPVCGMEVSRSTAADELEYRGKTFYFCASSCREAFEAEPE